jgi:riboflavin synthase
MFTGIIEEIGTLQGIHKGAASSVFTICGHHIFDGIQLGDSISVNGVCLTAKSVSKNAFTADVMHETLKRSSLGFLKAGSHVNLERALPVNGRFGGHIVLGHVDGTGEILNISRDDNAIWYSIKTSSHVMKYIVEKGSIAIDGISLTVAKVFPELFRVSIIPHTLSSTTLVEKSVGDKVNLENDILGKYAEKLLNFGQENQPQSNITSEFLSKYGYTF